MKDEPEITIAKMDATANDVPSPYEVRGYVSLEASLETDFFLKILHLTTVYIIVIILGSFRV